MLERGAACVPGWDGGFEPIFRGDTELFLKYTELPMMVRGNISLFDGKFEAFCKAGYGLAFMTAAFEETTDLDGIVPPIRNKIDFDTDDRLNRLDHGFHSTIGLGYQIGKGQLFFETAYFGSVRDADRNNFSKNRNLNFKPGLSVEPIGYFLSKRLLGHNGCFFDSVSPV